MNNLSIKKNIFKNGSIAGLTFILTTLMAFAVRTFFVYNLGDKYLGLNGVFSSIIQALSLTDLGMEAAFSFVLYKPIANNNQQEIVRIIRTFKKVYEFIGILILILGIILIPFLSVLIGKQGEGLSGVLIIYLIFLANSVGSYFFTYNRTLLNSDQRSYVISLTNFWVNLIGNAVQILSLIYLKSPIFFAVIMLLTTFCSNIIINFQVKKYYSFIFRKYNKRELKVPRDTKIVLIKNSIGGLSNKLGSMVVFASDNILISVFVNLSTVGLYANYTMITNNISGLINRVVQPMVSSIGKMREVAPTKVQSFFESYNFFLYSIILFVVPQLFVLLNPFIEWWLGEKYLLAQEITLLIVINLTLQIFRLPSLTFIDAYGLQWVQKWKSVFESIVNILCSIVFLVVFHLGLRGILLGTIFSTLVTVSWYEPYIVLNYGTYGSKIKYFFNYIRGVFGTFLAIALSWIVTHKMIGKGLFFLLELSLITLFISFIAFFLINIGNKHYLYLMKTILKKIQKKYY